MEKELLDLILEWFIVSGVQIQTKNCMKNKLEQLNDYGYCDIHGRFNLQDLAYKISAATSEALEGATK